MIRSLGRGIRYLSVRWNGTSSSAAAVSKLKASGFSLPQNNPPPPQLTPEQTIQLQTDSADFAITKLVHGVTPKKLAITERAVSKLRLIIETDKDPDSALRIGVESGGCHGFQYNLKLTQVAKELAQDKDNDLYVFKRGPAQVIIDDSSLEILQDSKVDYTKELIGSQFKVVDSPYTSTSCGCGSSFDFDFDKLEEAKLARGSS
ncbi:[4Fe-4S] proteins maturation [Scheffersomyces spartinae]|uniref:[4Fe-4S] proteins maturation n=1 Tax=Scheffersomyces spartinae TaxID=45513 RepID=A0A9P8AGZ8_9ASCO|nr:[4Fe-4S] proteins maturation [Scheffersomyces spartinae]KAG7192820.1 [4Fe-4S] proteins maturation [Scheffersomyces spartinae]